MKRTSANAGRRYASGPGVEAENVERLHLRIPPDLKEQAAAIAEAQGLSLSAWVRMVVVQRTQQDAWAAAAARARKK